MGHLVGNFIIRPKLWFYSFLDATQHFLSGIFFSGVGQELQDASPDDLCLVQASQMLSVLPASLTCGHLLLRRLFSSMSTRRGPGGSSVLGTQASGTRRFSSILHYVQERKSTHNSV